jgi:NADPH:quinone reductase-like Zn-dependent oxidoreductase
LGAHEVVDTKSEEFQAQGFVNFARRADAVIDTVGGKTQAQLFPVVKPGGVIVSAVVRPDTQRAAECRVRSDYLIGRRQFLTVREPGRTAMSALLRRISPLLARNGQTKSVAHELCGTHVKFLSRVSEATRRRNHIDHSS